MIFPQTVNAFNLKLWFTVVRGSVCIGLYKYRIHNPCELEVLHDRMVGVPFVRIALLASPVAKKNFSFWNFDGWTPRATTWRHRTIGFKWEFCAVRGILEIRL